MELQHLIIVPVLLVLYLSEADCILAGQFFPRGDEVLSLGDDDSSGSIPLSLPYPVLGRQWTSLWVNSNGVISLNQPFPFFFPRFFPNIRNGVILCPFWIDLNPGDGGTISHTRSTFDRNIATRVEQLIQQSFGYSFTPTGVFITTWERIPLYGSQELQTNTFQCVLATNGQDTFVIFLYADEAITGRGALIGIDGNDRANYFTVPESQGTYPSNVDQPGLWIFKADGHIIGGPPDSLTDVLVITVDTTEATLGWTHGVNNSPDSFRITCLPPVALGSTVSNTTVTSQTSHTEFTYFLTGLNEFTNYTCFVTATNIFGDGPPSDPVGIATDPAAPSGPPLNVSGEVLSPTSLVFEWSPPSEEERNGPLTGYSVVLEWEEGQEHRVDTADTNYTFTELQQGTTYHCSIAARTSVGTGPYYIITVATPIVTTEEPATFTEDPVTSSSTNATSTDETRSALNFGLVGGAAGGATLLVVMMIIVVIVFIICVKKLSRRKSDKNMPTSPDLEMEDRSVKTPQGGKARSNTYMEDPDKQIDQYLGGATNPSMPSSTSATPYSCANPVSVYMPLRHSGRQQEENSQYTSLCDATRRPMLPPKPKPMPVPPGSTQMDEVNTTGNQAEEEYYSTVSDAIKDPEFPTLPQKPPVPGTNSDNVYMPLRKKSQGQEEQQNQYAPLCPATREKRHLTLPPKPTTDVPANTNGVHIRGRQPEQEEQQRQHAVATKDPKHPALPPKPPVPRTRAHTDNVKKPQGQEEEKPRCAPTRGKRFLTLPPKPSVVSVTPNSTDTCVGGSQPAQGEQQRLYASLLPVLHTSTNSDGAYMPLRKQQEQEEQKTQSTQLCVATKKTKPPALPAKPVPPRPPKSKFK